MELIQSITVSGTATASVTFTDIPQDSNHLFATFSARTTANTGSMRVRFIGDLGGDNVNLSGTESTGGPSPGIPGAFTAAGLFISGYVFMPDYNESGIKSALVDSVLPNTNVTGKIAHSTDDIAAVTTLAFLMLGGDFFADQTKFSLYKITAGTGGATFS
jgi:hypothetical protein